MKDCSRGKVRFFVMKYPILLQAILLELGYMRDLRSYVKIDLLEHGKLDTGRHLTGLRTVNNEKWKMLDKKD
ncbi:TPA: hypothetical protein ACG3KD_000562 [Clostridioides difficile]|nr:hypothetical protein [Clostridioides difficile]